MSDSQIDSQIQGQRNTSTKPALGKYWSNILNQRIYFSPSIDRLSFRDALLSGSSTFQWDSEVLSYEAPNGAVYTLIESLAETVIKGKSKSCSLYIAKYQIWS